MDKYSFAVSEVFYTFVAMEELYHYAWLNRLYSPRGLSLNDGRPLKVVSPGIHNHDAGPDFSYARIEIEGVPWAGNVEIHVKASDWYRHGHDRDRAYDSVILHVVAVDDTPVYRTDGSLIPQMQLKIPDGVDDAYQSIAGGLDAAHCSRYLGMVSPQNKASWLDRMGVERLQSKSEHVMRIYSWCGNDWQQTCFIIFARALGFGLNADPMEMLARSLPLNYAGRHADNVTQIEAMLFGLAGMLNPNILLQDAYYQYICREYRFLSAKYHLIPMDRSLWKFARTRPQNFPHRRIALLAKSLEGGFRLLRRIVDAADSLEELIHIFDTEISPYWQEHYTFGAPGVRVAHALSRSSLELLVINAVAPMLYVYGAMTGEYDLQDRAADLLMSLKPERNSIVRSWSGSGLECDSAFLSQALLHLRREYCNRNRCRDCHFGACFLSAVAANSIRQGRG